MIELAFVGDIMLARGVGEYLTQHPSHGIISTEVLQILDSIDIRIGNLECPITLNATPKKKGAFKASPESLNQIKSFDVLSLANNHIRDCGKYGASETIENLNMFSLQYVGLKEKSGSSIEPIMKLVKGKKIVFFSCAVPECIKDEIENDFPSVVDATDENLIQAINSCKISADYIFVLVHGGNEMIPYPEPSFRALCQKYIDNGANFVITSHPHVMGGYENYKTGIIFYSLGDFIFDSDSFLRKESAVLKIRINGTIDWEYIPTTINKNFNVVLPDKKVADKILDGINHVSSQLSSSDYSLRYPFLYKKSLLEFQKDRIKFKIKNRGFLHLIGFIIKKVVLIPFYTKKLVLKNYK